jgi:Fe-S cluster assembly iron-binding protein IscA
LALDEPKGNEQPVRVNGIDVLIADSAMPLMDGSTVDYVKQPHNEGFIITRSGWSC